MLTQLINHLVEDSGLLYFGCIHPLLLVLARVFSARLRPRVVEETCEANSRGAVAVAAVGNTGNNVVGLPADHTDIAGRGYGTEVALHTHPRSHKMGWSVKGRGMSIISYGEMTQM